MDIAIVTLNKLCTNKAVCWSRQKLPAGVILIKLLDRNQFSGVRRTCRALDYIGANA